VVAEVQRLTNMAAVGAQQGGVQGGAQGVRETASTERELVAIKQPTGHSELVAVLAYHLTKNGQTEFTSDDIRRAYARAGQRPPKVMAQALRDAKNLHDLLENGTTKGSFRLSTHGDRTVEFDLPKKRTVSKGEE
jgi:hypothetical protein